MPTITLKLKNKSLGDYKLQNGISLTIGRRKNNDVVIEDPAVSGHHAKIDSLGDRYVLIDLALKFLLVLTPIAASGIAAFSTRYFQGRDWLAARARAVAV